jgi:hypothetical protein
MKTTEERLDMTKEKKQKAPTSLERVRAVQRRLAKVERERLDREKFERKIAANIFAPMRKLVEDLLDERTKYVTHTGNTLRGLVDLRSTGLHLCTPKQAVGLEAEWSGDDGQVKFYWYMNIHFPNNRIHVAREEAEELLLQLLAEVLEQPKED